MNLLILGSGGREHALAWRLAQDEGVERVHVMPGNPGMRSSRITTTPLPTGAAVVNDVISFARENKIGLVVIGPEKFLFEGWVDSFQKEGIPAFGPTQAASFLEGSKIRSKQFMFDHQVPTAKFSRAGSLADALQVIDSHPDWEGYALKLSGPALGKGVIVTESASEAKKAAEDFFHHRPPGIEEGMVIEERMTGPEVSLFYVCSKDRFQFLASACDHKRLNDGDQGPNTGGMGAYSPAHSVNEAFLKDIERDFVIPTLRGMNDQGTPFSGMLFLGLMLTPKGPRLLEYNTRFGDPETQTFLPLLKGNLTELLLNAAQGSLSEPSPEKSTVSWNRLHAVHVVKAAKGYPGLFGEPIESGKTILKSSASLSSLVQVFYAGVKTGGTGGLETSGGRVLGLTALGETPFTARELAYHALPAVSFEGEHFRKDIAAKAGGVA